MPEDSAETDPLLCVCERMCMCVVSSFNNGGSWDDTMRFRQWGKKKKYVVGWLDASLACLVFIALPHSGINQVGTRASAGAVSRVASLARRDQTYFSQFMSGGSFVSSCNSLPAADDWVPLRRNYYASQRHVATVQSTASWHTSVCIGVPRQSNKNSTVNWLRIKRCQTGFLPRYQLCVHLNKNYIPVKTWTMAGITKGAFEDYWKVKTNAS